MELSSKQIQKNGSQPLYTPTEEFWHSLTHGIGALLSLVGLVVLIVHARQQGDLWHLVSFSIFGSSLLLLYLASTLYHAVPPSKTKRLLQRLDHSAIYLLIAGGYTPFFLGSLRGYWGWSLFSIAWGLALMGITLELTYGGRIRKFSQFLYLFMGWLVIISIHKLFEKLPRPSFFLILSFGFMYTVGFVFYAWRSLRYNHLIFHLFVLVASSLQYFSVLYII